VIIATKHGIIVYNQNIFVKYCEL